MVKTLANGLKFRTACFTSLCDLDGEKKKLRLGADVVISTPGRLLQLLKNEEINLSELRVMVLDEADVLLLDESFPLQPIGQACKHLTEVNVNNVHSDGKIDPRSLPSALKDSSSNSKFSKSSSAANNAASTRTSPPALVVSNKDSALPHLLQVATQFLFVTATLPDVVVSQIVSEFPEVMTLKGPGLHRIASSVEVKAI